MKKNKIVFLSIGLVVIITIFLCFLFPKVVEINQKKQEKKRYTEIKKSAKQAVEWYISAVYPKCSIAKEKKKISSPSSHFNSKFLINNGYIKKKELLDTDNKSYCDIYVKIKANYENPLDHQNNCEISYAIYLKCKN